MSRRRRRIILDDDDDLPPAKFPAPGNVIGGVLGDEWNVEDETQQRKILRDMGYNNIISGYMTGNIEPPPLDLGENAWDRNMFVEPRRNNVWHMDGPVSQYPKGHNSQYVRGLPNDILAHLRSSDYVVDEKDQFPSTGYKLPPQHVLSPVLWNDVNVPKKYKVPKLKTPDEVKALNKRDQRWFNDMEMLRVKTWNDPSEIQYIQDLQRGVFDKIKLVGGNKPRYDPREDPRYAHYSREIVDGPIPDYFLYNVNPGGLHVVHPSDLSAKKYWGMMTDRAKRALADNDNKYDIPEPSPPRDKYATGLAQRAAARRKREESFFDEVPPPSKIRKVLIGKKPRSPHEMHVDDQDFRLPEGHVPYNHDGISSFFEPVDFRNPRRLFKPDFVKALVTAAATGDKWRQHQCSCNSCKKYKKRY